jgi:hypothetical protein
MEDDITTFFEERPQAKYLAVSICDDPNAQDKIKTFLGMENLKDLSMGEENKSQTTPGQPWLADLSTQARMRLGYFQLFTPLSGLSLHDTAIYLENACKPGKSLPSESSHHYLINDACHSLRQYLGLESPHGKELKMLYGHFDELAEASRSIDACYRVFSIPEKYSIYHEFLPICLSSHYLDILQSIKSHPAAQAHLERQYFVPTAPHIASKKSYGDLYYHGDTHLSSIGAYHAFNLIISIMLNDMQVCLDNPPNHFLAPAIGSWLGDLAFQTPEDLRSYCNYAFSHNRNLPIDSSGLQNISYIVHFPLEIPTYVDVLPYLKFSDEFLSPERPKNIYTNSVSPNEKKVVLFRDSTATEILPSLVMNFKEIVSVWDRNFSLRRKIVLQEKPDYVVVITADRFLCNFL